ncbi:uncharacterized protein LOC144173757 isoform X2 [Haemaphysalis longicornis]
MARPRPREASMTAPSGSCVLYCCFSKIQSPEKYFKGSCFRRGIKLYASNHVYGVKEEILSETAPSEIVARCIPQMKSTCDYDVRLEMAPRAEAPHHKHDGPPHQMRRTEFEALAAALASPRPFQRSLRSSSYGFHGKE